MFEALEALVSYIFRADINGTQYSVLIYLSFSALIRIE